MVNYIFFGIFFIWSSVVSFILYKTRKHYFHLISQTRKEKLDDMLDQLLRNDKKFSEEIYRLNKELITTREHSKVVFQKIGLVRFNPFERPGGEQSFVLALLNNHNSGIIINFIHTREGLRSYIKQVKNGKGEKYELSEEENEAVKRSSYYQ
ncbi:DUF4446 family protein [Candidatus Roizmanbacteria bacterium]|nr:DUF4446 family protein [Candidatus Roizmanbacteria bacterium]